jgi:glycogen debranching enzyme
VEPIQRATDLTGTLVLKHDILFLVCDAFGDIHPDTRGLGLYLGDTRVLNRYEMRINGARPVVLRTGGGAGYGGSIQLTNPDIARNPIEKGDANNILQRQSLGIVRERLLSDGLGERIRIQNYTMHPERCRLTLRVDADFADIFEVRGVAREKRGERLPDVRDEDRVVFGYQGLDARVRRTELQFSERPRFLPGDVSNEEIEERLATPHGASAEPGSEGATPGTMLLVFDWLIDAGAVQALDIRVTSEVSDVAETSRAQRRTTVSGSRHLPAEEAEAAHRAWHSSSATVGTTHHTADRALRRGMSDLRLLVNSGPGPGERFVAAGVPWYNAIFGRDAIITALQMLSIRPQIAQEALQVLARLQATEVDDWRDAQPGKILHELRTGEMAAANEIAQTPYYGSVDSTPLWLILLGEYERWTGDLELVERLWPAALGCLRWIDEFGDADGDGFVEFQRHSTRGLINQGWKDSGDANRWTDGRLAAGPLALVEVQAYVYQARLELARLSRRRGDVPFAEVQERTAARLREGFEACFWIEEAGTYALCLDGDKRPVDAIASNAGHVLWCGMASPERARRVADRLLGPDLFSGWGIRTLSSKMSGYNPIGYHLGSIWPHDNAICAAGLWRYGFRNEAARVAGVMLEATQFFRDARLPELFCGFDRADSPYPVPYPVACSPQAWAAGSIFQLLGAMLGMQPDAANQELRMIAPTLPEWLPEVRIENLRVGEAVVDLLVRRNDGSTGVEVLRRTGELSVVVRV